MKYDKLYELLNGGNAMIDSIIYQAIGDGLPVGEAKELLNKISNKTINERMHLIGGLREMWLQIKFIEKLGLTKECNTFKEKHMRKLKEIYEKGGK